MPFPFLLAKMALNLERDVGGWGEAGQALLVPSEYSEALYAAVSKRGMWTGVKHLGSGPTSAASELRGLGQAP